ncbi:MAG: hypothetical protein COA92_00970 [Sulfurovum sp.]|nr:MAG: hypothetical protein COA92_00970 [Sulfurovum sp.]
MRYNTKWSDRRSAAGSNKPFIYMFLEIITILMACWLISKFDFLIVSIISYLVGMYYIITSVIPRFKKVMKRQKKSQY